MCNHWARFWRHVRSHQSLDTRIVYQLRISFVINADVNYCQRPLEWFRHSAARRNVTYPRQADVVYVPLFLHNNPIILTSTQQDDFYPTTPLRLQNKQLRIVDPGTSKQNRHRVKFQAFGRPINKPGQLRYVA